MAEVLRILLVEDSDRDAELVLHALERSGVSGETRRVQAEPEFRRALREFRPHIVLSDFAMPRFSGVAALKICQETDPDLPFIFVSGTIGEDVAVQAMKAGATDYVMKTNLIRLGPAVQRELREAGVRRGRRLADAALRRAQTMAKLAHIISGPDGSFESWSDTLPQLIGLESAQMPGSTREWLDLLHPADRQGFREISIKAAATRAGADVEYRLRGPDNAWIHIRQVMEPLEGLPDRDGKLRWFTTLQDVTEQARAAEKIKGLNRVYAMLSGINALIVRVRNRAELFREACRIAAEYGDFGIAWIGEVDVASREATPVAWAGVDSDIGSQKISARIEPPGGHDLLTRVLNEKKLAFTNDLPNESVAGRPRRAEAVRRGYRSLIVLPLMIGDAVAAVLALFSKETNRFDEDELKLLNDLAGDISFALDHIAKAERLDYLAYYDLLTGLANRTLFCERLGEHARTADRSRDKFAVCIFDVERFKTINDSFGRQTGDALLRQIAARMTQIIADPARLGRISADGFALMIPGVQSEDDAARRLEQKLRACFGAPFRVEEHELRISAKAGLALFPSDGVEVETLFANAEAAWKKAKETGDRYLFYTQRMSQAVAENLSLENKLRLALERNEFVLHYQPKVDLETRDIVGVEALIRWQSPELGLVPPMQFIPLMEQTGLILEAGAWALRQAVLDHRKWIDQDLPAPRIAVNVSAIQLRQRDFVSVVTDAISRGVTQQAIDLEITESLLMDDIEGNIEKLRAIRDLGVRIAIDDFGTGHSSLAYLARLPVEALKIDRSFIITMVRDPDAMTLVRTIISLAHSLNLTVVAEGVDSEEQARMLRLLRCNQMQGYLFSKPLSFEAMTALLKKR